MEKTGTSALFSAILGVIMFAVLKKTDVNQKSFLFDICLRRLTSFVICFCKFNDGESVKGGGSRKIEWRSRLYAVGECFSIKA